MRQKEVGAKPRPGENGGLNTEGKAGRSRLSSAFLSAWEWAGRTLLLYMEKITAYCLGGTTVPHWDVPPGENVLLVIVLAAVACTLECPRQLPLTCFLGHHTPIRISLGAEHRDGVS